MEGKMLIANNQIKARKILVFSIMVFLLFIGVADTNAVRAAVPIPSGYTLIFPTSSTSSAGVRVYEKRNSRGVMDYVTIVDMRYGTLRNFTGEVSGTIYDSAVRRYSIQTFWSRAIAQNTANRKAAVVINGTFFDPNNNPAKIAFGLKADWWRISYGYAVWNEFPGLIRTFAFDSSYGSSSIQPYNPGDRSIFDGGIPNVVGGLDPSANKDKYNNIARTFVGVGDDNNDTKSETVIFFSSSS